MVGEEQVQDTIREEFQLAAQWPHARHNGKIDRKHAPILAAESRHTRHVLLHPKQYQHPQWMSQAHQIFQVTSTS